MASPLWRVLYGEFFMAGSPRQVLYREFSMASSCPCLAPLWQFRLRGRPRVGVGLHVARSRALARLLAYPFVYIYCLSFPSTPAFVFSSAFQTTHQNNINTFRKISVPTSQTDSSFPLNTSLITPSERTTHCNHRHILRTSHSRTGSSCKS